jgi:hypothetical protein
VKLTTNLHLEARLRTGRAKCLAPYTLSWNAQEYTPFQAQVTTTIRQSIFIFTYGLFEAAAADDCEQGITTSDEIIDDLKPLQRLPKT